MKIVNFQAKQVISEKEIQLNVSVESGVITASYNYKETEESVNNSTLQVTKKADNSCESNAYNISDFSAVTSMDAAIRTWLLKEGVALIVSLKGLES